MHLKKKVHRMKEMKRKTATQKLLSGWIERRLWQKPLFFLANSCAIELKRWKLSLNMNLITEWVSEWVRGAIARIQFRLLFDQSAVSPFYPLLYFFFLFAATINFRCECIRKKTKLANHNWSLTVGFCRSIAHTHIQMERKEKRISIGCYILFVDRDLERKKKDFFASNQMIIK